MNAKQKESKNITFFFPKWIKGKDFVANKFDKSTVLVNGLLITCIILSIASGFIDLTFFSGLSKSFLHLGTFPIAAAVLYTVISIGFILGKFWCAMKIGMLKELKARLTAKGKSWANNLNKALIPWHLAHKFLIAVSIITALSLSVNSIGPAMKDAERNTTNITISIEELQTLKNQRKSDNTDKRSLTRGNLEGTATASTKAQENADKYWPIFENWQSKYLKYRAELENETDEEKILEIENKIKKERQSAYDMAPRGIGVTLTDMDTMSPIILKNLFTKAAKQSEIDSESIKAYEALTNENDEEIRNTILALENLYRHPNDYKDGVMIEGKPVSFLDENGEPMDITQVIGILQGLREEWRSNSDTGESSQIFMLISEVITSKLNSESSGSGFAEILMMVFIAIAGIVQEFLIAIFTPKATIDRKLLSQVSQYLLWSSNEEKERFLISVYKDYVGDGIINQEDFNAKCKKCVELMEETEDDIITKYSKKNKSVNPVRRTIKEELPKVETPKGYSDAVARKIKEVENI